MTLRQAVLDYVKDEYGTVSEHLWKSYPTYEVLRHEPKPGEKKAKWYGIIMNVSRFSLGLPGEGMVDILDVKLSAGTADFLRQVRGYLPAYHMNKQNWIAVLLDGTVPIENIRQQIDESYSLTDEGGKKKKAFRTGPIDWLVPAAPAHFDIVSAFSKSRTLYWKQSTDIRVGDLVYMYVGAPCSALMYKCRALEVNIPCDKNDGGIIVKKLMKIELLADYGSDFMPLERMKREFGVYTVRGPRYMPNSLKEEMTAYEGEL